MFYFSSQINVTSNMCGVHCTPKLHKLSEASKVSQLSDKMMSLDTYSNICYALFRSKNT